MLFLSPYNFISAIFIDKTVLSLSYHLGEHWSLKGELFSACTILRAVVFPRTGTGLKHAQNALPLPLWFSALVLRLHSSEVAVEGVSLAFLGKSD